MKTYTFRDTPIKIFGLAGFAKDGRLQRLPDEVIEQVPSLHHLGRRCPGARMEFRTDAKSLTVVLDFKTLSVDVGMSLYHCQSAFVQVGKRTESTYIGLVNPSNYEMKHVEKTFALSGEMQDVTVWLPRNEQMECVSITAPDEATVLAPTEYTYSKPILYYGSSITEGGCSCNIFNAYNAIISRHLDVDYYNFGFSGNAKGELAMADYINTIDMSIFVYDYDHNAPNAMHLAATHEPFFKRIREAHPDLPVIMMTRPKAKYTEEEIMRREIVKATYENALAAGDTNVYFLDGETFYGESDRELCSMDTIHPNDLGFLRMAQCIEPLIEKLLKEGKN